MSRMLTRSAKKTKPGGAAADFEFEENESHHFDLKSRTPRTPYQRRTSQKRKRGNLPESEVGRTVDANFEVSPNGEDIQKVLTQNRFQDEIGAASAILHSERGAGSPAFRENGVTKTDLSFGNDSFLLAVNQIEENNHHQPNENCQPNDALNKNGVLPNGNQIETYSNGADNCSQDIFGDDAEFMDALPATPDEKIIPCGTPKRSRKRSITSKRLSVSKSIVAGNESSKVLPTANEELQQSENASTKDRKTTGGRKRTAGTGAGDKKKKKVGGGPSKGKKKQNFKLAFTNRKAIKELANSASNELSKEDLSYMTNDEKLQLSSWGLPSAILKNYHSKGITSLFQWQLDCLSNEKVLEGRNLLYSAPTSAGKTLVSEILMIKRVLELGRKAIMILPFVSVAREKVYSLQSIFGDAGVRVEGFMGSINPPGGFKAVDIAICTIEKANSLLNRLLEEDALADLGTLVVDELHLIGDPHRGYLLELLLAKILYMTSIKNGGDTSSMNFSADTSWRPRRYHIQVIGMSATLPNLEVLAKWLKAELYVTDFRPVPLKETLKMDDKLLDEKLVPARNVVKEDLLIEIPDDIDNIVYLALETVLEGFSVLIFCPTKAQVERTAEKLSAQFYRIGDPSNTTYPPEVGEKLRANLSGPRIKAVLDQLKQCAGGSDDVLTRTVMFGIGYHHAGLTYENRDIVESAFKRGILKVIVATSTLSAGVNLPARRVMITTPLFNGAVLDTLTYRQMCGRAGRNGIDTEGESILICPATAKEKGMALFKGSMLPVRSALLGDGSLTSSMKRALLEAIASGIASLTTDVRLYAKCTFLFHSLDSGLYETEELSSSQLHKESTIEECVRYLETQDLIRVVHYENEEKPDEYMPTQLGSACLAASLSPDDGIIVYKELLKARECFVLENELHVIYQVTPIYVSDQLRYLSWSEYLKIFDSLDVSEKKVAALVGIKESFIIRASYGSVSWSNPSQRADMAIHQRFFAALALSDLVNEKSLDYVARKYQLNKGVLQNLQQAASTFAGMVTAFCGRLGWSNLELLLSQFQERLEFGVQRELCDLVRLDCLNGQRARILYDAGVKTLMELAATDPAQVEQILHKATPFKSNVHGGRESNIWMIGKDTLTESEAAQKIVSEARVFIQIELGHKGNVQFGFGHNDVPPIVPEKSQRSRLSVTRKSVSFAEPKSGDEKNDESGSDTGHISDNDKEHLVKEADLETPANSNQARDYQTKEAVGINENDLESKEVEEERDVDLEELFTQRHLELETSQVQGNFPDTSEDGDMFEESFPEIVSTNISALYPKSPDEILDTSSSKFSLEDHIEKCKLETKDGDRPKLQHSTPVLPNGRNHRFTLRHDEYTSPVRTVNSPVPIPAKGNEEQLEMKCESNGDSLYQEQISERMLAEFNKEFENSNQDQDVLEASNHENKPEKPGTGNTSLKLSESDMVAMLAMAEEDSKFESEELFPIPEESSNEVKQESGRAMSPPTSHSMHSSQLPCSKSLLDERIDLLDGLDEEDFILTQGPEVSESEIKDDEMFQESASDTESDSVYTDISKSSSGQSQLMILEGMVGKSKLVAKIIQSADMIPDDFFRTSELVGVGLKIASSQVKSAGSLARQGIGSLVLGRKISNTSLNGNSNANEHQRQHSIAVYNGQDTIWVLHWNHESYPLLLGGKSSTKTKKLEALLFRIKAYNCFMSIFDCKEKLKSLLKNCGHELIEKLPAGMLDPKIAQWIWEFDDEDWNITKGKLVEKYVQKGAKEQVEMLGWDKEITEAFFAYRVMAALREKLDTNGLWNHFTKTEMPSTIPLLLMEMNGFGLDGTELSKLKRLLQFKINLLQLKAFQLAGRQFNLNSPTEISKILFKEIGLKQPKAKGTGRNVLLKLDHELPKVIIEYRKVANALNNMVIPFQQVKSLETSRIHGHYSHFTCTGRVVMSDPSLQCIPRDFDIQISYDEKEIFEIKNSCRVKFGSKLNSIFQQLDNELADRSILENVSLISMRNAFVPCSKEFVILTADYSQLELRILAHLSGDSKLVDALNRDVDIFVEIASQWKNLPKAQITDSVRQDAKSIVYGVIYGMGPRSLAETMDIDEREAGNVIRQFMKTYPRVQTFIDESKKACEKKGYVETMTGRRRYLPHIYSRFPHEQEKARRQAVNTQIQGSAADLVKCAMTRIDSFVRSTYPKSLLPMDWTKLTKARRSLSSTSLQGTSCNATSSLDNVVFFPILNLHDELIFEVRKSHLETIAKGIRLEMERSLKLKVKLPVVIKTGDSWGSVLPYDKS